MKGLRISGLFVAVTCLVTLVYAVGDAVMIEGKITAISRRAGMILIDTGKSSDVIEYGDDTSMVNLKNDDDLFDGMIVKADVERTGLVYTASKIEAGPSINISGNRIVSDDRIVKLMKKGMMLYDLRGKEDYRAGHIPGASHISTYQENFDHVIMYCFDRFCTGISDNNRRMIESTTKNLFFQGGIRSWREAKKPLEASIEYFQRLQKEDVPFITIDIRDEEERGTGFIPGAISISSEMINLTRYRFPIYLKAVIFVYGNDSKDMRSEKSAGIISSWGYKNVFILQGGIETYRERGLNLSHGDMKEGIDYRRKYADWEQSVREFRKYVESLPDNIQIIDVRDREEAEKGKFKNSINIPLEELQFRLDEIDRSKHLITHCGSGQRATIAYHILKKAGFNVSCLNAYVGFDDLGLFSISDS